MDNGVIMQYFEWFVPDTGAFWDQLRDDAAHLAAIGITAVWLPPACKATGTNDVGYGIYDLFDLGEFDQKGAVRTKYGTRAQLEAAIAALHAQKISVYFDAVMNHKAGADHTEKFLAKEVNPNQREDQVTDVYEIEGWTGFDFPGRNNRYSDFKWHWYHFTGTDYNQANGKSAIYKIQGDGKDWDDGVDTEFGNYDYLMFADIDFNHPEVLAEMKRWALWLVRTLPIDGVRLDAIKHINDTYIEKFLDALRTERGSDFYAVGEYWKGDIAALNQYLAEVQYRTDLFDVPLHYKFFQASEQGAAFDLRTLLDDTLVRCHPELAVTFVDNHDSQWGSALQSPVQDWFKPPAYGLILLMRDGYPCVFYGDYYRTRDNESPHHLILDILLDARRRFAFGDQHDYFDHPNTVGFVRLGDDAHPGSGLALLISNSDKGTKTMNVGSARKGETWRELTGSVKTEVTIKENGDADFSVESGKLAVWVKK